MRKLITIAATAISMFIGLGFAAVTAGAATPECSGSLAGFCGSEVNVYGNAWTAGTIQVNAKVTASPVSTASAGGDLIAMTPAGASASVRQFELAPANEPTGLCVSEPSVTNNSVLQLRPCRAANSSLLKYQEFTGINPGDTAGTPWVNVASGLTVQPNGTGNALRAVKVLTNRAGSYWGWDLPAIVPAP